MALLKKQSLANCDWLGRTIAFCQTFLQQGRVALRKWCIGPQKGHPRTPGMEFFVQCPGLIFLAARWSGLAASVSIFLVCLDYILRVCQSLWDSFLYLGKLYWFLYLLLSYFYDPGMFIFRWSSNFVEEVVLCCISCLLPFLNKLLQTFSRHLVFDVLFYERKDCPHKGDSEATINSLSSQKYLDTFKNTFVERSSQYTSFSSKTQPANARNERKQFTENASIRSDTSNLSHWHFYCLKIEKTDVSLTEK